MVILILVHLVKGRECWVTRKEHRRWSRCSLAKMVQPYGEMNDGEGRAEVVDEAGWERRSGREVVCGVMRGGRQFPPHFWGHAPPRLTRQCAKTLLNFGFQPHQMTDVLDVWPSIMEREITKE
jgi:hypothetical protein